MIKIKKKMILKMKIFLKKNIDITRFDLKLKIKKI